MENRIKEQQLCLFVDRTSCSQMRANQFRLYFPSFEYVLMQTLRWLGLKGPPFANAQCSTLRVKLSKIAARVDVNARRVWCSWPENYHGSINSHELCQSQTSAGTRTTCITPASPSMTIMAAVLDRSPGRGGRSRIWGLTGKMERIDP